MTTTTEIGSNDAFRQRLVEILAGQGGSLEGDDPWLAIAQSQAGRPAPSGGANGDDRPSHAEVQVPSDRRMASGDDFTPLAPTSIDETGLSRNEIESLVLKYLLNRGAASGRDIADQIHLPFRLIERLLRQLKESLLLVYKSSAPVSDYVYELTEPGCDRARRYSQRCTYFGTAPVSLRDYMLSVQAQSITRQRPRMADLKRAFSDLLLAPNILSQLGQAMSAGLGLFLYGAPGNGKTSIAERIMRAYGKSIWLPRAVSIFGEIVRLYDPGNHEALPSTAAEDRADWIDKRWIRVRRPTIIVGGELTLDSLEVVTNAATGISEAPLQMKANCGALVIDDFGRQRVSATELLNRWIVPLEKRHDYLSLANGRKFQVPFDQLIVFSTNLEPKQLVDEAFLRRIPYKIDIGDPSESDFRQVFQQTARALEISYEPPMLDYLIETHFKAAGRPMRFCHARDLLRQVCIYCTFHELPLAVSREALDAAADNYFAIM